MALGLEPGLDEPLGPDALGELVALLVDAIDLGGVDTLEPDADVMVTFRPKSTSRSRVSPSTTRVTRA